MAEKHNAKEILERARYFVSQLQLLNNNSE
jgi:hypothetical protein